MTAVTIRTLPSRQAASRWDRETAELQLELEGPGADLGVLTWSVMDRVEADHAEGERALAWEVLQSEVPRYGFHSAVCFLPPWRPFSVETVTL